MSADDSKMITLLQRVYENTQTAKLDWEPSSDPNLFSVGLGDYTLMLERSPADGNSPASFVFRLQNDEGQVIEEITGAQAGAAGFDKMELTFKLARRLALDYDHAIDDVLRALGELPRGK